MKELELPYTRGYYRCSPAPISHMIWEIAMKERTVKEHLANENNARQLRESVGSFIGFMERGAGNTILNRIPGDLGRRLLEYVEDFKRLT